VGLGCKREAAPKRPIRNVDLSQKNSERARLQALFERPGQIPVAVCFEQNESVWIEPKGEKARTMGAPEFASAAPCGGPQSRSLVGVCQAHHAPGDEREAKTKRRPAVSIGGGLDLVHAAQRETLPGKGAIDLVDAEGPWGARGGGVAYAGGRRDAGGAGASHVMMRGGAWG